VVSFNVDKLYLHAIFTVVFGIGLWAKGIEIEPDKRASSITYWKGISIPFLIEIHLYRAKILISQNQSCAIVLIRQRGWSDNSEWYFFPIELHIEKQIFRFTQTGAYERAQVLAKEVAIALNIPFIDKTAFHQDPIPSSLLNIPLIEKLPKQEVDEKTSSGVMAHPLKVPALYSSAVTINGPEIRIPYSGHGETRKIGSQNPRSSTQKIVGQSAIIGFCLAIFIYMLSGGIHLTFVHALIGGAACGFLSFLYLMSIISTTATLEILTISHSNIVLQKNASCSRKEEIDLHQINQIDVAKSESGKVFFLRLQTNKKNFEFGHQLSPSDLGLIKEYILDFLQYQKNHSNR